MTTLRLGTRRSPLALTQSEWVATRLRERGHTVELVEISTFGDETTSQLTTIGGTGVFAAAIRRALLDGSADLAVHSLKDLPTTPEPGLVLAAIPPRDDPRDVLVARDRLTLGELPRGSRVGTGSPRRTAQLAALGLGITITPVRGNVDTRIGFVRSGAFDAVVLARAGLARLGRLAEVTETMDPAQMLPAPGQGALAVECREDRFDVRAVVADLDDHHTRVCVTAERALLAGLEAGCTAPVGAFAEIGSAGLSLRGFVGSVDGRSVLRRSLVAELAELADPASPGRQLADLLLQEGAAGLAEPNDNISPGIPIFPRALETTSPPLPTDDPNARPDARPNDRPTHHTEQVS